MADGLFKKIGSGFDRYIGGLLGEDVASMTPEERRAARMAAIGIIGRGMVSPEGGSQALSAVRGARQAQRQSREEASRVAAAEALMPDIASRLLGGRSGAMIQGLEPGEAPVPVSAVRVPSEANTREALRMMYGTQAGRDVAQMAPDLAKLAQEGVTGRTVGGSVYNPVTGQFSRPPMPLPAAATAARSGGAAPSAARTGFRLLSPDDVRAAGLPEGTVAQQDLSSGKITLLSQVPAAERTSLENKERAVRRIEVGAEQLQKQLDKVATGGPLGIVGAVGRVFDSQDARLFETLREQLSSALRAALRIPGEGALSDREQAQYGLTLPSLGLSKERNIEVMRALENQVRLAANLPTLDEEKPQEIDSQDWLMMLPSERAAFKRAGAK